MTWAIPAALAAGALLSFRWTYEPDLWWHLAQGRELAGGHLVRANLFSWTHPDYPQSYTSWLFDLGGYLAWRLLGTWSIQAIQTLLLAATFMLLYAACRRRAGTAAALGVLALGFFVIELRALPRPHLFSFTAMAALAYLVEEARARGSPRPLLAAAPLIALWANVHVEALFGAAFVGAFALGELVWPQALARRDAARALAFAGLAALAPFATPYGFGIVRYLRDNGDVPSVIRIAELLPPYMTNYVAFFAYALAAALLVAWRVRRLLPWEALVLAAFGVLAFRHLRFTALFFVATAPIVAARAAALLERGIVGPRTVVLVPLLTGLLLMRTAPAAWVAQLAVGDAALAPRTMFPVGALAFAQRVGLEGPAFTSNNLGGYAAWAMYPQARVFSDGRLQAYPLAWFREIMDASRAQPAWDRLVAGADWAVLSLPRPNQLSGAGRFPPATWARVYWDEAAELLVRRSGRFGALAAESEYQQLAPGMDPFAARVPAERLTLEAERNLLENPEGFTAPALLCLQGDRPACDHAAALAERRPELARAAQRLAGVTTP